MPHARIRSSYDLGPEGTILIATSDADPAAGAEILVTVPGRAVWEIIALNLNLDTDATVTNRRPQFIFDDGAREFALLSARSTQAANTIFDYSLARGFTSEVVQSAAMPLPLPDPLVMLPGWRIRTSTANLQAGDNYAAPVLYVREVPQRGIDVGQDALRSALRRLIGEEARSG